ncbi:hypothetical protein GW17_00038678, partial [Ensete ventricosum]
NPPWSRSSRTTGPSTASTSRTLGGPRCLCSDSVTPATGTRGRGWRRRGTWRRWTSTYGGSPRIASCPQADLKEEKEGADVGDGQVAAAPPLPVCNRRPLGSGLRRLLQLT